jgi:predicted O-methyltransferase YrrM
MGAMGELAVDVLGRAWRLLPEFARSRVKTSLAARNIGRLDVLPADANLSASDEQLGRLRVVLDAPTEMSLEERLFLYSLVRGLHPARVLEIGTSRGGSAAIIASAMEENESGMLVGIDPMAHIELPFATFKGRFHLVSDVSPNGIGEAARLAGRGFDLVLIDGPHTHQQSLDDILGVLPHTSERAFILLHDAFHFGVSEAIRETVERDPTLHDCGYVCRQPRRVGDLLTHAGFRLLRRGPAIDDPTPWVEPIWREVGLAPPHAPDLRNHDIYVCVFLEPCEHCRKQKGPDAVPSPNSVG